MSTGSAIRAESAADRERCDCWRNRAPTAQDNDVGRNDEKIISQVRMWVASLRLKNDHTIAIAMTTVLPERLPFLKA